MLKCLETLAVTLGLSRGWNGLAIMGNVEDATIAKPLGMKFLIIRIIIEHVPIPLLNHAKQEEGVALVGGRTRASVGEGLLVNWKMGRAIVDSK